MLKIKIVDGHQHVQSREFKTDNGTRVSYWQDAYMENGGAFPERMKLPVENESSALAVGAYVLLNTAFKTDKYDGLEVDRFNLAKHLQLEEKVKKQA